MRASYHQRRLEVSSLLGNKCNICGESDPARLQIHHLTGADYYVNPPTRRRLNSLADAERLIKHGNKDELELLCITCHRIVTFFHSSSTKPEIRRTSCWEPLLKQAICEKWSYRRLCRHAEKRGFTFVYRGYRTAFRNAWERMLSETSMNTEGIKKDKT